MTIAHNIAHHLDAREALDKQAQRLFEFNERCGTTHAGVTPEAKVKDGP
jgi:hypothetical protein